MQPTVRPVGTKPVWFDSGRPAAAPLPKPAEDEQLRALWRNAVRLGPRVRWAQLEGGHAIVRLRDFPPGGAHLRPDFAPALDDAAKFLLEWPWRRVWISGCADSRESRDKKTLQWLSLRRARYVWDALLQRKVPGPRLIELDGGGDGIPADLIIGTMSPERIDPVERRMVEVRLYD